jgi:hypothetical protein
MITQEPIEMGSYFLQENLKELRSSAFSKENIWSLSYG